MHPFREAVEAHDFEALAPLLAPDVTFLSPVAFKPYQGRDLVAAILRGAGRAFTDFRYVREIASADCVDLALMFEATVGGRDIHGCDFLRLDDAGLISEFCVMVRPLSAAQALSVEMAAQFDIVEQELGSR